MPIVLAGHAPRTQREQEAAPPHSPLVPGMRGHRTGPTSPLHLEAGCTPCKHGEGKDWPLPPGLRETRQRSCSAARAQARPQLLRSDHQSATARTLSCALGKAEALQGQELCRTCGPRPGSDGRAADPLHRRWVAAGWSPSLSLQPECSQLLVAIKSGGYLAKPPGDAPRRAPLVLDWSLARRPHHLSGVAPRPPSVKASLRPRTHSSIRDRDGTSLDHIQCFRTKNPGYRH